MGKASESREGRVRARLGGTICGQMQQSLRAQLQSPWQVLGGPAGGVGSAAQGRILGHLFSPSISVPGSH